jgi:predicted lipid-binding transport protein (Tim44 family)
MEQVLQLLAGVLILMFILTLIGGGNILTLGVFAAFLAVLVGIAHMFYAGFDPYVALAVVAAAAAGALLMRLNAADAEERERKPLFDVRLADEKCVPLEEGVKALPAKAAEVVREVLGTVGRLNELCFQAYEGGDVSGGRSEAAVFKLFFVPDAVAMRLARMLSELGPVSAVRRGLVWYVYFAHRQEKA